MLDFLTGPHSTEVTIIFLLLASMRIWLEIIGFEFSKLPISNKVAQVQGQAKVKGFHKMGLVFSIGYILLFAPTLLMS